MVRSRGAGGVKLWPFPLACWYVAVRIERCNQYSMAAFPVVELRYRKAVLRGKDPFENLKPWHECLEEDA